ncbi:MAG: type II secretion system F family protein [Candidatus Wolfebacteria bacterium]|nr:type II secretion system F family protein [Candidatus Wolfebacteria bacterium]
MKYKYTAKTQDGELQAGFIESGSKDGAVAILRGHNLFILTIEGAERSHWYDKIFNFLSRVKINDLMLFTRQFSILLESKVSIGDSLRNLEKQTKNALLKEAIKEVSDDVDSGLALSQALEKRGDIFSDFYVNMIRPAEITGRMDEAMLFLADYIEKESAWISKIRNAMIYPFVVIFLFLIVAGVLLVAVFPQIGPVFIDAGVQLPLITRIFLGAGDFILKWWFALLVGLILFAIMIVDYMRSEEGRLVANELKIRLPIVGNLYRKIYVARFAEAVSVLIKGGVPLTQAIEISGRSIQNAIYSEVLHEIAEGVKRGELFSALLYQYDNYFPSLVGQLVSIGEGAGRIDEVLSRINVLYTREVNNLLDNLVELIQPLLITVIGVFIGLLFASILLPIYNLAKAF